MNFAENDEFFFVGRSILYKSNLTIFFCSISSKYSTQNQLLLLKKEHLHLNINETLNLLNKEKFASDIDSM